MDKRSNSRSSSSSGVKKSGSFSDYDYPNSSYISASSHETTSSSLNETVNERVSILLYNRDVDTIISQQDGKGPNLPKIFIVLADMLHRYDSCNFFQGREKHSEQHGKAEYVSFSFYVLFSKL